MWMKILRVVAEVALDLWRKKEGETSTKLIGKRVAVVGGAAMAASLATLLVADPPVPTVQPLSTVNVPLTDGRTGDLTYGGALGLAADGQSLFHGCFNNTKFARISLSGVVLEPCFGPSFAGTIIDTLGGIADLGGGKRVVSAYSSYDAAKQNTKSHYYFNGTAWSGPFAVTDGVLLAGQVGGYMAPVPATLQAALKGAWITGQGAISIITRSNLGPGAAAFDPIGLASGLTVPATSLIEYPDLHRTWGDYGTATTDGYSGSESLGGGFFVSDDVFGVTWTQGQSYCYGEVTANRAQHMTANPGAGPNEKWCYDLSNGYKGPHGYWSPAGAAADGYTTYIEWYRVSDMKAAAAGSRKGWDNKPFARTALPGLQPISRLVTGGTAYDPATKTLYATFYEDRGAPKVHRWSIDPTGGVVQPPPSPTNCIPGVESMVSDDSATATCVNGTKTITEQWTRTGDIPATNGGAACTPVQTPRQRVESCVVTPPPPTTEDLPCTITGQSTPYADGDIKRTIRCDTNGPKPKAVNGTPFTLTIPK